MMKITSAHNESSMRDTWKIRESYLLLALVLAYYLVVAYSSVGYNHEDEHYQIIEFANYKLGLLSSNELAWEFGAKARSGLQPLICFLLFKAWRSMGITDGYVLAFLLRAFTAVCSAITIWWFANCYKRHLTNSLRLYFTIASFLVWFLPYINVRFSSETWSGLLLLITLVVIEKYGFKKRGPLALIGFCLGCSILFRYQSALFAIGILSWLYFICKVKIRQLALVILAIGLTCCFGVLIDLWLYGEWTLSIYNYLYANTVQGASDKFGIYPFYQYFWYTLTGPGPFGVLILGSFFMLLRYNPNSLLLWAITPFIIAHSIIPHKELRFLYPLANLCPLLFFLGLQHGLQRISAVRIQKLKESFFYTAIIILILFINLLGLYAVASTGADLGRTSVTKYIHENFDESKTNVILNGSVGPYRDWKKPKNTFYNSDCCRTDRIIDVWQEDFQAHKKAGYTNLLVIYKRDITGARETEYMKSVGLVQVYQSIPDFTTLIYSLYNRSLNDSQILVYEFR